MSIERCNGCNNPVDTDFDAECAVEVGNMRRMTWTVILCETCREEQIELESERASAADRCIAQMEDEHERRY